MAEQQVWLVTGASRGLGLDIAKTALKGGHRVIACHRGPSSKTAANFAAVETLGGKWLELDVAAADVEAKVKSVIAEYGKVDVLVNNAGYAILGTIEETSPEEVEKIFRTNFLGTLRPCQAVIPSMRERRSGTIVNISSGNGVRPLPALGIYSATKFAVEGMTEALQAEISAFGIRTLLIQPGLIRTEFSDPSGSGVHVPLGSAYEGTPAHQISQWVQSPDMYNSVGGAGAAEPADVARRIVGVVDGTGEIEVPVLGGSGLRVPLGKDMEEALGSRAKLFAGLAEAKGVWGSV
ncbi:putative short chain oxidoreductase/dehydrogenase [Xylariomycetidae sp. FL2044]|nr:putative short chain oxidoreductase/dehydrogenase [Xylariomycetidae sp. FL2044]